MQKTIIPFLALIVLMASCNNEPEARKDVKQYTAEQLFNNKSIGGVAFNSDESKILVNAKTSGIFNLYEIGIADTSMKPLTRSTKESFFAVDYLPGTNKFLYSADEGGNENNHVYLQSPGDTSAKDLTPWPKSTNSAYGWSDDKKSLFISSNKRNQSYFDLWKADTVGWNATLFYQNDSGYDPSLISFTERYIALTKSVTTDKNEMYLYDRTAKKIKNISIDIDATWNPTAF